MLFFASNSLRSSLLLNLLLAHLDSSFSVEDSQYFDFDDEEKAEIK